MKLSIRLQNHGKKNHPLWWIVVAPNRKNIFGRYIEHVGYWYPDQGLLMKRKIILNIPRIKYWMNNGAVPTFKVHRFLAMWNLLPFPWYFKRTPEELAQLQPNEQQLTDKQKIKLQAKRKKKAREVEPYSTYWIDYVHFLKKNTIHKDLASKFRSQVRENQILREVLFSEQFDKMKRVSQLSSQNDKTHHEVKSIELELQKAKSQLAMIKKQNKNRHPYEQQKLMKKINEGTKLLHQALLLRRGLNLPVKPQSQSEYMTQSFLDKHIDYAVFMRKMETHKQELKQFQNMHQPVTIEEFAAFLIKQNQIPRDAALRIARKQFHQRGQPMIKLDLLAMKHPELTVKERNKKRRPGDQVSNLPQPNFIEQVKKLYHDPTTELPNHRPVHPMPDFKSYIPQQHYQPISMDRVKIIEHEPLEPHEELAKYHQKRQKKQL